MIALLSILAAALGLPATQAQVPSGDAMQMFRALSPEQQRALLESFQNGQGSQSDVDPGLNAPIPPARAGAFPAPAEPAEPRIRPGDTVLLDLKPAATDARAPRDLSPEQAATERLRTETLAGNPYRLDRDGQLWIPGLPGIVLAGLTEQQATERLTRDPAFASLAVKVTLLTLRPLGTESLKPFGYELFSSRASPFAPATDIPVPAEYVVGPGDAIEVQLLGNTKGKYNLIVSRDGDVRLPDIGPVTVAGLTFPQVQDAIGNIVAEQMIGTRAVVSMGRLRSVRVLVTGEAEQPGTYTVGGLATITNVLAESGGVRTIGSLRNVELKRAGKLVARLDLYDLLLSGDSRNDERVLSGDVVFIPPVGPTVSVLGEIRRPAIYEIRGSATAAELVTLGGGLTPEADPASARIERIDPQRGRIVVNADLTTASGRDMALRAGDVLRLDPVRPVMVDAVTLSGHVHRPGSFQYRAGMRISDLLRSVDDLRSGADLNYVLIRRESGPDRRVTALSADVAAAWQQRGSEEDVRLAPRDQVTVFDLEAGRERAIAPLVAELTRQGRRDDPAQTVGVGGRVRMPGQYPLEPGMTVSDLVRAGASLAEAALGGEAELTRYEVVDGQTRQTRLIEIDLARALAGDPQADIALQPFDYLVIKEISLWSEQETVQLEGEVRFPGRYPIKRGETLGSVLARAGGLTELAFIDGSIFTRKSLREREARQIEQLAERIQRDLAAFAVQSTQVVQGNRQDPANTLVAGQALLEDLRKSQPVGRLVIDLRRILSARPGSADDLVLKDGDRLAVPRLTQEVTVLGEVQGSTSHLYDPALSREDYLRLSGGLTQKADARRIYVVRANGGVEVGSRNRWFASRGVDVRPGDTIVVPLDTERLPPLPMWTAVTTIIYNLAVAVAAVNSF